MHSASGVVLSCVLCSGLGEPTENIWGGAERKSVAGLHQQQAAVQAYVCSCVTHIIREPIYVVAIHIIRCTTVDLYVIVIPLV